MYGGPLTLLKLLHQAVKRFVRKSRHLLCGFWTEKLGSKRERSGFIGKQSRRACYREGC
jgi:hypothetical protein